jgi:hypothetical protein
MTKKAKKKAKIRTKAEEEEDRLAGRTYVDDDEEEGEWVEDDGPEASPADGGIEPQAVPGANLSRGTTVTSANPTPPTNVPVVYQGTPPTTTGLVPAQAPAPDVAAANIILFSDPLNGATQGPVVKPDIITPAGAVATRAAELAGKAEFSGLTSKVDAASGRLSPRGVVSPGYSETPNLSHPSYGT